MLTHGRSRAYTKALLGDHRNTIIFCGFSVDNSLASIIKQGKARVIKLGGRKVPNMCNVVDLHSFTSHAQRDSLLQYYSSVDCEKVLLVHGDMDGKVEFAADLEEAISKNNKTSKVVCVNKGYSLSI
jgi:metallo-beta-lactamase family protein